MRIILLTLITIFIFNTDSLANHVAEHSHFLDSKESKEKLKDISLASHVVKVQVNGLVCDFCARALEKIFSKQSEVVAIDVNLDDKLVSIGFKQGANISDDIITKLITDSGYNVVKIMR